jgi:hypothetical protein
MKDEVAFETEVFVCICDELVQQHAEIQYYYNSSWAVSLASREKRERNNRKRMGEDGMSLEK